MVLFLTMLLMNINIYTDGGSRGNPGPSASSFVLYEENELKHNELKHKDQRFLGIATNNIAEYIALLMALRFVKEHYNNEKYAVHFHIDSELVVKQITGIYKIKDAKLKEITLLIKKLLTEIASQITFEHVVREKNTLADSLVNEALDQALENQK